MFIDEQISMKTDLGPSPKVSALQISVRFATAQSRILDQRERNYAYRM